jgi:glycosyltransferase involved in cell wall biosynthesis
VVTPELYRLAEEPLDHPWFAPGQPPVILGVGRLEPQKDFATLLRAFSTVHADRPCRLVILGEGGQRRELQALAAELGIAADLAMPGFVTNPYAYLRHASLFAFSSRWEGFGNALVEALAVGTPVVSTDCPDGPSEILEGGRFGPLVPVGDHAALADAMRLVLDGPPAPDQLRAAAQRYTQEVSATAYLEAMGLDPAGPA